MELLGLLASLPELFLVSIHASSLYVLFCGIILYHLLLSGPIALFSFRFFIISLHSSFEGGRYASSSWTYRTYVLSFFSSVNVAFIQDYFSVLATDLGVCDCFLINVNSFLLSWLLLCISVTMSSMGKIL